MRRIPRLLLVVLLLASSGALVTTGSSATAQAPGARPQGPSGPPERVPQGPSGPPERVPQEKRVPPDDPARGLVYRDLRPGRAGGPCAGLFEFDVSVPGRPTRISCTHGPDPAPPGFDVGTSVEPVPVPTAASAPAAAGFACSGDGTDGYRVQVVYARASDRPDRYEEYRSSFIEWAAGVDDVLNASAAETGASQRVRWVTDASCAPVIERVVLPPTGDDSLAGTTSGLRAQGYTSSNRKYLVFVDSFVMCGLGEIWSDDSPSAVPGENDSNGRPGLDGTIARVDAGCWNRLTAAHELMHGLGGVQFSAPHSTGGYHCTDESDRLCYDDDGGGPVTTRQVCPPAHEERFDCNHDDYYHTAPPAGSYLATHWNTANSAFLTPPGPPSGPPSSAPADFDGNGTTDLAVFRPSTGTWFVRNGTSPPWGVGGDVPVPADYDGNGTTDFAVLRPSTGIWFVRNGVSAQFGTSGDIPVPGDYDGNGTADFAVFRPSTGTWFVRNGAGAPWGLSGDIPVPGDYDGNGTTDFAVFRPSTGTWYVRNGAGAPWGVSGDIPVPGDYDGNGTTDFAVFRPSTGTWFVRNGVTANWGTSGDVALPLPSAIRLLFA